MGRGKEFRPPRRRGFDDDEFSMRGMPEAPRGAPRSPYGGSGFSSAPSAPMQPSGPTVDATVKWFNPEKGFGFAELADGTGDAFLHIAVLEAAGHRAVSPGATLKVTTGQGQKGRQITQVLSVDDSTATAAPPRRDSAPRSPRPSFNAADATEMSGTVKWYNRDKGFGFVSTGGGGKDVFVHVSVLQRAGLTELAEGQQVSMQVVETPKGREATSISADG